MESPALASAQDALRRGAWAEAVRGFLAALEGDEAPEAREGLAQAYWWLDDGDESLASREAAYRGYRKRGDDLGAARAATSLAWDAVLFGRGAAVARGWYARAADLLQGLPVHAEHGWHAVRGAELALTLDDDTDAALASARVAGAIGRELADDDLAFAGQAYSGLALVMAGDVDSGMHLLDGAVAAATAGDVADPMWMGKICCWLIVACRQSQDIERAAEWCARVEAMSAARELAPLTTVCRIQYAAILVSRGSWTVADAQLRRTLDTLSGSRRESRVEAVAELGELRRRQGRLAEAEALLRQAEFFGPAVVSRARLRIDQGEPAAAWLDLSGLLDAIPSANLLARAAVLPTAVAAAVAIDDLDDARRLAGELDAIARRVATEPLRGFAAAATGSVSSGAPELTWWREAVRWFAASGLRYEEAHSRRSLADALAALGDVAGAAEQRAAAAAILDELGVRSPTEPTGLTARQREVLRLIARGMTNADIARELTVSEHTVHRHVANILLKLGLGSRTAAAAYAAREHLI
ncbi:LuxR family transcriptional regulator [Leifsonia shinshuensis]|nr:LuxR family transcriptional regulator [Leifsonia shinshuensis]